MRVKIVTRATREIGGYRKRFVIGASLSALVLCLAGCGSPAGKMNSSFKSYTLNYDTPLDASLQSKLETLDARLRGKYGMTTEQTAVGALDLRKLRLAMIHPDRIEYAASVAKIGILLAWFELHPREARNRDPQTRRELGLMIKSSSNEMAAKFSNELGLKRIQHVLDSYGFYDREHGGGI